MKPALFIGAIASVLALNAFATSSTVTSKDYVDAQDALKQNKIPAAGTNASTPGETVVTYTTTGNGVIGERGIFDFETGYDDENGGVVSGHEGDLVTAGDIVPAMDDLYNEMDEISSTVDNLPEMTETTAVYANCFDADESGNCLLWNLHGRIVYGPDGFDSSRPSGKASNCKVDGEYCSENESCCSGACGNNKCYTPLT